MATIIGLDIDKDCIKDYGDGIVTEFCDQSNEASLLSIADRHNNTDIIIDDGSHIFDHQLLSFNVLFPKLKPRGIYVIEDVYLNDKNGGETGKIFYEMQNIAVSLSRYQKDKRTPVTEQIYSMTFFDGLIVLQHK